MQVNNGENTLFWEDIWIKDVPLKLLYPTVYGFCREKKALVSECNIGGSQSFDFYRSFGSGERREWEDLWNTIKDVRLKKGHDYPIWVWEKSKTSSVNVQTILGWSTKEYSSFGRTKFH